MGFSFNGLSGAAVSVSGSVASYQKLPAGATAFHLTLSNTTINTGATNDLATVGAGVSAYITSWDGSNDSAVATEWALLDDTPTVYDRARCVSTASSLEKWSRNFDTPVVIAATKKIRIGNTGTNGATTVNVHGYYM